MLFSKKVKLLIFFSFRGAELFQAIIVKAVKARLEEEKKSMDQLKRQYVDLYLALLQTMGGDVSVT